MENEQQGQQKAAYAENTLQQLSDYLTREFGKGYSVDNLERARKFYLLYGGRISATASRNLDATFKLSWSHYVQLLKITQQE